MKKLFFDFSPWPEGNKNRSFNFSVTQQKYMSRELKNPENAKGLL